MLKRPILSFGSGRDMAMGLLVSGHKVCSKTPEVNEILSLAGLLFTPVNSYKDRFQKSPY